jgi:hypothetical protein
VDGIYSTILDVSVTIYPVDLLIKRSVK